MAASGEHKLFWPPYQYDSTGFKVVVDGNAHSRAAPQALFKLLTYVDSGPVLTKAGKPKPIQPPPHKDETGHYYRAQLQHYGLPATADKNVAKKRLLDVLGVDGKGKLTVPADVNATKKVMEKKWETDQGAMKGRTPAVKAQSTPASISPKTTAPRPYPAGFSASTPSAPKPQVTKIASAANPGGLHKGKGKETAVKFEQLKRVEAAGQAYHDCERTAMPMPHEMTATPTNNPARSHATSKDTSGQVHRLKQTAKKSGFPKYPDFSRDAPPPHFSQRAGGSTSIDSFAISKQTSELPLLEGPRTKQTARKSVYPKYPDFPASDDDEGYNTYKKRVREDDSPSMDDGPSNSKNPKLPTKIAARDLSATYEIICRDITEEWHNMGDLEITLQPTIGSPKGASRLWAAADMGLHRGIMIAQGPTPTHTGVPVQFKWRGRDAHENMIQGGECEISFLGAGKISGIWVGGAVGGAIFTGKVITRFEPTSRNIENWQYEHAGYSEEQYERERVGRWH